MAAFIQQKFDTYVYTMPWNRRIFGDDKNVSSEIAQYSEKILSNNAEKYSLQGTTQGRYLTGGVPPVRFSM